ncbi:hypothetical protein J7E76_25865 [Bacillus sp. ISL-101]|uniref:hypothetical protein n=1 Tax=Bacillus sp. ISL-101 TaxID=2819117 RepID=UPI001BEA7669|nr:hypothetical protein [Bacillus sp. ISL-101]MBT2632476.1 hypothetical protein [Bacillus sp. ISL-101]
MAKNIGNSDNFKQVVKRICKIKNINPQKPKFEVIDNLMVISIKNHLKDGVDLDCFNILNLIYGIIGPLGIRFNQQMYLYPNSERLARVTVSFKKEDYDDLNRKMKEFCE